ncbi:MAG: methyltransferase domain-containing protein [Deltaproteobacteria bacterium]|nr:methyltransferase domain-containing protein [Deltaproteobacteria bacterium]
MTAPRPRRLNLGCGRFPLDGFVNVDRTAGPGIDIVHDLSKFPYPFPDRAFELVEADHVLEHLPEVFEVMREIHRILEPGGTLVLRVPHFSRGFSHPEHRRGFDATFPYYFDPKFQGGFTGVEFEKVEVRMRWFAQPYLKQTVLPRPIFIVGRAVGAAIDLAANVSPLVCSRIWCNYVGGFEEIEFVLRKPGSVEHPRGA